VVSLLHECVMTREMSAHWQEYLEDAKATLESAFHTAMTRPELISDYTWRMLRTANRIFELHAFVIGYAGFCIATNDNVPDILLYATLRDGWPLYPVGFIPPRVHPLVNLVMSRGA
jgi:hypothetical protein